ncbi:MAG: hypothetical protein CM15mV134_170 [uncultured marine virus]|nr:MAG: hypothetical protein CM15mV134_170 [uncultured marine virus]
MKTEEALQTAKKSYSDQEQKRTEIKLLTTEHR